MTSISKHISAGVGLATEAYSHHKQKKQEKQNTDPAHQGVAGNTSNAHPDNLAPYPDASRRDSSGSDLSDAEYDEDEEDWIRDETQAQLDTHGQPESGEANQTMDQIIANFIARHPPPPYPGKPAQLPCPVIIPQRRPETKSRGFVRAYAPALQDCGIDEQTFMDFHEGFHKATNKQGWFHASNIAVALSVLTFTVSVAPSVIVHTTALMVHTSIEAGRRMHISHKTNDYLDRMNENLFKPRGLYAMIMTYKPDSPDASSLVDVNRHIVDSVAARQGGGRSSLRTASGKTHGEAEMPDAAPLVFPKLQAAGDEEKKNAFKRAIEFSRDYGDRRAQATFEGKNPDSKLNAMPHHEFSSRWADPNHPANQGTLITMLSGGAINPRAKLRERKGAKTARREAMGMPSALGGKVANRKSDNGGGLLGIAKRKLKEDVLYLMVVNMPSEEELRVAAQMMQQAKLEL